MKPHAQTRGAHRARLREANPPTPRGRACATGAWPAHPPTPISVPSPKSYTSAPTPGRCTSSTRAGTTRSQCRSSRSSSRFVRRGALQVAAARPAPPRDRPRSRRCPRRTPRAPVAVPRRRRRASGEAARARASTHPQAQAAAAAAVDALGPPPALPVDSQGVGHHQGLGSRVTALLPSSSARCRRDTDFPVHSERTSSSREAGLQWNHHPTQLSHSRQLSFPRQPPRIVRRRRWGHHNRLSTSRRLLRARRPIRSQGCARLSNTSSPTEPFVPWAKRMAEPRRATRR